MKRWTMGVLIGSVASLVCLASPFALFAQWIQNGNDLYTANLSSEVGIGLIAPVRQLHVQGNNACLRLDRDVDSSAFILCRTQAGNPSVIWKGYTFGVNASGVNNGQFVINDLGAAASGSGTRRLTVSNDGNVGIGTSSPARTLHVNGAMRLQPQSSAPSSPSQGDVYYNQSDGDLYYYDGTSWVSCGGARRQEEGYSVGAAAADYVDNGDGTVTDQATGLMWAQDGDGEGCAYGEEKTWEAAVAWAENLEFAGYDDWRLPSRKELESLVDDSRSAPAIDPIFFDTRMDGYWTSTSLDGSTSEAWFVDFLRGAVDAASKASLLPVRAVRVAE